MYEKTRAEGFGAEVQRRIMIGTYVLSAGYLRRLLPRRPEGAHPDQARLRRGLRDGVDAILTPTTPVRRLRRWARMADDDPIAMYLNDVFTVTVNLAGLPGISVPAGLDEQGLPLGLQLIGRPFDEGDLLNVAYALEGAAGFVSKPGKWW